MNEFLSSLAANLTDTLIYLAIGLVTLMGVFKCIIPVRRAGHRLRRAIHLLETNTGEGRPVWQDVLFLGKEMQVPWRRFLVNAEQLDARGLNCNVEDYINDDSAIYAVGHEQLGEVIPSLLTSLGILGTFIGLMRGLGGLDVSDAAKTMESIPQMIAGMTFAFMTSIAGISCSLAFNVLNRMAHGSAVNALDDFTDAFTDIVMQKPLDDTVQLICQQEDRSAQLRHLSADLGSKVSDGIVASVEKSLAPVSQSMNAFILGQTQAQIDGVGNIANQFITQMNRTLSGQFVQLGQTLSAVNQAQSVSFESINRTMAAADQILSSLDHVQSVTERVMKRFESYIDTLEQGQEASGAFLTHGSQVLSGIMTASQEQDAFLSSMKASQKELQASMKDYAAWSGQVLSAVQAQAQGALQMSGDVSKQMDESSQRLSSTYAAFVDQMSGGFSRSLAMFDENIHSVLSVLTEKLEELRRISLAAPEQARSCRDEAEGCAAALSQLQRALAGVTAALEARSQAEGK